MLVASRIAAVATGLILAATAANAAIVTVFDGVPAGSASFDSTVASAGGTSTTDVWSSLVGGLSIDRGAYTVTRNNGGSLFPTTYGGLSGEVIDISPTGSGPGIDAISSGITFAFNSPVNAIGFEVGDWATCCFLPTNLYMSFDDGTPIQVASATQSSEGQFPNAAGFLVHEIFVAAADDSGDFSKVQFWGDGFGEFLVAGGSVKYALLDEGTLPGPGPAPIPAPAAGLLLLSGFGGMAAFRLRRRSA